MKSIIRKLINKKISISVAESCTGGLLSSTITSISGASTIFNMGLITYSNISKTKILKVNKVTIKNFGAVSSQCCEDMVKKLSNISKSKIKQSK